MRQYKSPEIHTLETLTFETVCASSGFQCPGNYSSVHTESMTCWDCFRANASMVGGFDFDAAESWGMGAQIKQYLANGNRCPAGYSSFSA